MSAFPYPTASSSAICTLKRRRSEAVSAKNDTRISICSSESMNSSRNSCSPIGRLVFVHFLSDRNEMEDNLPLFNVDFIWTTLKGFISHLISPQACVSDIYRRFKSELFVEYCKKEREREIARGAAGNWGVRLYNDMQMSNAHVGSNSDCCNFR